jgi:glycogen debranching enzyme
MSISIPQGKRELYFRNHHNGANDLFPLRAMADGEVVAPRISVQPCRLVLSHEKGRIEVCFESPRTVRMRGQGLSLELGGKNLAYSEGPALVTFNKPHTRRYQVEMLHGSIELHQLISTQPVFPRSAVISPAADGRWELAIDEFWSTWRPAERASFDDCVASAKAAFNAFLATMPHAQPQDEPARALAAYVNWSSAVEPSGLIRRSTLFMSKNWMSNVWSWDQCFNAIALAQGQPELALDQMLILVDHQDEFGAYPDSINDVKIHYNFSKPPVHGLAFREMLSRMPRRPSQEVMQTMYTSLSRQADWWMTYRRRDGDLLPYYLHGNDSGWDNSTMFRLGVPLIAPDLAALLLVQMDVLAELAVEMGRDAQAEDWRRRANALHEALLTELWSEEHFIARLANDGSPVENESLITCVPIILGQRLPGDVRNALRTSIEAHLTDWGLATETVDSPHYREDGYWRGPIWAPSTWLVVAGLDRAGSTDLADSISQRFCRMCGRSGFAENFNALTGEPLCDPAYTWTSSVFLLLAERMRQRGSGIS